MSKVTEDLGYKVEEVESSRIEAEKIDETFKSGFIGEFTSPFVTLHYHTDVIHPQRYHYPFYPSFLQRSRLQSIV